MRTIDAGVNQYRHPCGYNVGSMAFTYAVERANRLAIGTLSGTVRGRDIAAAIPAIYEDAAGSHGWILKPIFNSSGCQPSRLLR